MKISDIDLKIIPDSRGKNTLEVEMSAGDIRVNASVPSGKSTGSDEVFVLESDKAFAKFTEIKHQLLDKNFSSLEEFDKFLISLDGTPQKQNLGGNLILVLSIGFTKLLAKTSGLEIYQLISQISNTKISKMPLCFFNVINGGLHAKNSLPFQEYIFVPQNNSVSENLNSVLLLLKALGDEIQGKYEHLVMGDEGGYEVPEKDPEIGLKILQEVINISGQINGRISLDVAASTFYRNNRYEIGDEDMITEDLISYYNLLAKTYKLFSIEDPFYEKDIEGFQKAISLIGDKTWIVGDDLTTTNSEKIKVMAGNKACNAVILKPNQIGSVSETITAANLAKSFGWKIIVSHRSGETNDSFIADLAVGLGADGLKSGCPLQQVRLVKYQRLVEIESQLFPHS